LLELPIKGPDLWPPVGVSKAENEATQKLGVVVFSLRYFVESFAAALELYKFSRSKPHNVHHRTAWKWQWIAINQGAMQTYFLREAIALIAYEFGPCITVKRHMDPDAAVQRAVDKFDALFPELKKMRDGIAHAPTVAYANLKIPLEKGYSGPRLIDADTFELTNKGQKYRFTMTDETTQKLTEVLMSFWAEFDPVAKAFDQIGRSD